MAFDFGDSKRLKVMWFIPPALSRPEGQTHKSPWSLLAGVSVWAVRMRCPSEISGIWWLSPQLVAVYQVFGCINLWRKYVTGFVGLLYGTTCTVSLSVFAPTAVMAFLAILDSALLNLKADWTLFALSCFVCGILSQSQECRSDSKVWINLSFFLHASVFLYSIT